MADYGPPEMPLAIVIKLVNGDVLRFPHFSANERVIVSRMQHQLRDRNDHIADVWLELNGTRTEAILIPMDIPRPAPADFW